MDGQNFDNQNNGQGEGAFSSQPVNNIPDQQNQQSYQQQQPYSQLVNNVYTTYEQPVMAEKKTNGLSIASLVLGIVSIVSGCCVGIVGVICGIVGLVLGIVGQKKSKSGIGLAGIIVSIFGIVLSIISWIIGAAMLSLLAEYGYSMY